MSVAGFGRNLVLLPVKTKKMLRNTKTHQSESAGFTLIEMAVVIIISGFIFIPLMAVFVQMGMDEKRVENVENNDRILNAINFYYKQYGAYPCPADLNTAPDDSDFGVSTSCSSAAGDVVFGALPVQTLGLPYHQAINKYGWKHLYAVTTKLTDPSTLDNPNAVEVISMSGADTDAVTVPFILVNTGKDGKGSSSLYGKDNILACDAGASRDEENCDGDELFIDAPPLTLGAPTDSGYYDDKLSYGLANPNSDLWIPQANQIHGERVPLMSKTLGNIGVGVDNPADKLHVGDETLVESNYKGEGGDILLEDDVTVSGLVVIEQDARANTLFKAGHFCSGQFVTNGSGGGTCCYGEYIGESGIAYDAGKCCAHGSFFNAATGELLCKDNSAATFCGESDTGRYADVGIGYDPEDGSLDSSNPDSRPPVCCFRHELDIDGLCCPEGVNEDGACSG